MSSLNHGGLKPLKTHDSLEAEAREIDQDVLVLTPRRLGLGQDCMVGGPAARKIRKIDLSRLTYPVSIDWADAHSGSITDGADTIVFQGVDEIILPPCMEPDHERAC